MANNFRIADATANAAAGDGSSHGIQGYAGANCKIAFYTGTQNTGVTTPAGTLLGTVTTVTFGTASSPVGKIDCPSGITSDTNADDSGTAECFIMYKSDGSTPVADGTVGTTGCDINFDNNVFVAGGTIAMTSMAITVPTNV